MSSNPCRCGNDTWCHPDLWVIECRRCGNRRPSEHAKQAALREAAEKIDKAEIGCLPKEHLDAAVDNLVRQLEATAENPAAQPNPWEEKPTLYGLPYKVVDSEEVAGVVSLGPVGYKGPIGHQGPAGPPGIPSKEPILTFGELVSNDRSYVWDDGTGRRLRRVIVGASEVLHFLRGRHDHVCLPVGFKGVPDDIDVISVHYDLQRQAFAFLVQHASFDAVPEGQEIPVFEDGLTHVRFQTYRIVNDDEAWKPPMLFKKHSDIDYPPDDCQPIIAKAKPE